MFPVLAWGWGVVIFPSVNPVWNNPGLSFLKEPRLLVAVVATWERRCGWKVILTGLAMYAHAEAGCFYLNTAAAACWSWSCLCSAARNPGIFFFFAMPLAPRYPSQSCLLHNAYLCFTKCLNAASVLHGWKDWVGLPQYFLRNSPGGVT